MKNITVNINEPFEVKVQIDGTDYFKQILKITSIEAEEIIPIFGKSHINMSCKIEKLNAICLIPKP